MISTSITPIEQSALSTALARANDSTAGKVAILKSLVALSKISKDNKVSTSEICDALSEGATETGEKIMFKTISVMAKFISAWGVTAILVLGLYQMTQTAKSTASWLWEKIKSASGMLSSISPLTGAFSSIFHHDKMDEDPSAGLGFVAKMVAAEIPLVGGLFSLFGGSETPSPANSGVKPSASRSTTGSILGAIGSAFKPFAEDNGDPLPIQHDEGPWDPRIHGIDE